jgi:hypothetical protein
MGYLLKLYTLQKLFNVELKEELGTVMKWKKMWSSGPFQGTVPELTWRHREVSSRMACPSAEIPKGSFPNAR